MKARDAAMKYICGDGYDAKERLDEVEKIFRADTIDEILSICHHSFNVSDVIIALVQLKEQKKC